MSIIYLLVRKIFTNFLIRIAAFTTIVLGGGLGWLEWSREASDLQGAGLTMVNAFERGHDAFSTASYILSFLLCMQFYKSGDKKFLIGSILSGIVNCIIHPPFIVMYLAGGISLSLLRYFEIKKKIQFYFPLLITLFFAIYYFLFLTGLKDNVGFHGLVNQNMKPVELMNLLLGLGIIAPFALLSLIRLKEKTKDIFIIKLLFVIQFAFLYIPTGFNLYFLKGIYVWAVIIVFNELQNLFRNKLTLTIITLIIVLFSLPTRIYTFNSLLHADKYNTFFFLKQQDGEALQSLNKLPSGNVLTLFTMGNYIPAYSEDRVYIGHAYQTPYSQSHLNYATAFYTTMSDSVRHEFIKQTNINYIYYGVEEQKLRESYHLAIDDPFPAYKRVYWSNGVVIYKIR